MAMMLKENIDCSLLQLVMKINIKDILLTRNQATFVFCINQVRGCHAVSVIEILCKLEVHDLPFHNHFNFNGLIYMYWLSLRAVPAINFKKKTRSK